MFGVQRRGLRRDCNRSQLRRTDGKSGRCPHRFIDGVDGGRADRLADNHSAGIGRSHFGLRREPDGSASHVALAAIAEQAAALNCWLLPRATAAVCGAIAMDRTCLPGGATRLFTWVVAQPVKFAMSHKIKASTTHVPDRWQNEMSVIEVTPKNALG